MKVKSIVTVLISLSPFWMKAQSLMNIHKIDGSTVQIPINEIDSITYTSPSIATLTTATPSSILFNSAISGGDITNDGGATVTERGICFSTAPSPTIADNKVVSGSGIGSYVSSLSGLTASTIYYIRAYAINSAGTAYGNEVSFTTSGIVFSTGAGATLDGYTYSSIIYGNGQEWMSENLRTNTYANGDPIANTTDPATWSALTIGAWCHYNNNSSYEITYGKLYNWEAVYDSRNVCPTGWHVPSHAEWVTLINYIDPSSVFTFAGNIAGGKMKTTGPEWFQPNFFATNESRFSALPGGVRNYNGGFQAINETAAWWSTTDPTPPNGSLYAFNFYVIFSDQTVNAIQLDKRYGLSVRCLKD